LKFHRVTLVAISRPTGALKLQADFQSADHEWQ
jgi:hypothetical protein